MRLRLFILLSLCALGIGRVHADTMILPQPLSLLPVAQHITGPILTRASVTNKPVVVTFFASWCPPCRHEFEQLNALKKHPQAQNAAIVAINVFEDDFGKNPARIKRFLKLTKPDFSIIRGTPEMRKAFGNIARIPTLIVYDRYGKESWRFIHKKGATKMSAELGEIVAALQKAEN